MGRYARAFGPEHPEATYVPHGFAEQTFDTGEVRLNYAVAGDPTSLRCSSSPSLRQSVGPMFALWSKYLGDQWSIGDWDGMVAAAPAELPGWLAALFGVEGAPSRRRT